MARKIYDNVLLASDQRITFVVDDGVLAAVHLERKRLTPAEIEEIAARVRDEEYDTFWEDEQDG